MACETARLVGCPDEQVLVASTGVIGVALPMEKIRSGLPAAFAALGSAPADGALAARAIMTTDPFPKEAAAQLAIAGLEVRIGGMAKGSGMIEPMMATMLGFVTTDAAVPKALLDRALREAVNDTFNAITVDGECSTNDCVMLLANGASGAVVDEASYDGVRRTASTAVCRELALGIVRGGEGATKLVTVHRHRRRDQRRGAAGGQGDRELAARQDGHSRRRSQLGPADRRGRPRRRRLRSVARGGADRIDRAVQGRPAVRRGRAGGGGVSEGQGPDRDRSTSAPGSASSTVWTCDLSAEYVRINAEYRT